MNWLVPVTCCMFYTLDPAKKISKLKLTSLGYLPDSFFQQISTLTAYKQLNVFLSELFP